MKLTLETIDAWLRRRADGLYAGEPVTHLEHALQCAALAEADGAGPALVTAALLHDIGALALDGGDEHQVHAECGARMLADLFPPAVTEPIRLHVAAKRYLCVAEPLYWSSLTAQSRQNLIWQGAPFSPDEAVAFIARPYAEDAVSLRLWDDAAHAPEAVTPGLDHFLGVLRELALHGRELA